MSIIRLSSLRDGLHAPDDEGTVNGAVFNSNAGKNRRGAGNMGRAARPDLWSSRSQLSTYIEKSLAIEAANLPASAPVVVLIHGWDFDPRVPYRTPPHHEDANNPHARLYHFHPYAEDEHELHVQMRYHSTSWPLGLGIEQDDGGASGLAIGFGWQSAPGWAESFFGSGLNPYARAYSMAETFAWDFAGLLVLLTEKLGDRPIDIFCHSLGTRILIRALAMAADPEQDGRPEIKDRARAMIGRIGRVLLLAGAERVLEAQLMMQRLNRTFGMVPLVDTRNNAIHPKIPNFYNFASRENDVLDKLGENFGPGSHGSTQVIGHNGLEMRDAAWLDVQLDHPAVGAWFRGPGGGYQVSGDNTSGIFAVLDHWIHYTWPHNMRLYRDILRDRSKWDVRDVKARKPDLFDVTLRQRGHDWMFDVASGS